MLTYRSIGVVFLVIVVGPDGDLWQEFWYVGQVRHPLFVLHTVKRKRNVQDADIHGDDS